MTSSNILTAIALLVPFVAFMLFIAWRDGLKMAYDVFVFSGVGVVVLLLMVWIAVAGFRLPFFGPI